MIDLSWTTGYVAQASKTRVTTGAAVLRVADTFDKNTTLVLGVTPEATRSWIRIPPSHPSPILTGLFPHMENVYRCL